MVLKPGRCLRPRCLVEKNAPKAVQVEWVRRVLVDASCVLKVDHTCKQRQSRSSSDSDLGLRCWVCIEYSVGDRGRMLVRCAATYADVLDSLPLEAGLLRLQGRMTGFPT
jgi:hypothetical protein